MPAAAQKIPPLDLREFILRLSVADRCPQLQVRVSPVLSRLVHRRMGLALPLGMHARLVPLRKFGSNT